MIPEKNYMILLFAFEPITSLFSILPIKQV